MSNRRTMSNRPAGTKRAKAVKAPEPVEAALVEAPAAEPPPVTPVLAAEAAVESPKVSKGDKKKKRDKKEKKEKKAKKEAVLIRFEDAQLLRIDTQAEALGLSRAAWVRMIVAQALGVV